MDATNSKIQTLELPGKVTFPRTWNLGTVTAIIHWTSATEDVGNVIWGEAVAAIGEVNNSKKMCLEVC